MNNLRLKERDIKILYYISTQGFATAEEIHSNFFNSKKEDGNHYRRISKLTKSGFIEKIKISRCHRTGYRVSRKGQILLIDYGYNVTASVIKKDIYLGKYNHDLMVNKVKNILLASPLIDNFIAEYQIKEALLKRCKEKNSYKISDKIPDGLFNLKVKDKTLLIALEVELNLKSKIRYENIFPRHLLSANWDCVFYISKSEKIRNKLLEYLTKIKKENFLVKNNNQLNNIYFCLLDDILKNKLNSIFCDENVEFSINNFEKL